MVGIYFLVYVAVTSLSLPGAAVLTLLGGGLFGFWFKKPSANAAAIKAFVVNRVGDLGFMLGIFGT